MDYTSPIEAALKVKRWPKHTIAAGRRHTVGLKSDGTVTAVGDNKYGQCDVSGWRVASICQSLQHKEVAER